MNPAYREELDVVAEQGCTSPQCINQNLHIHESRVLCFHSSCHPHISSNHLRYQDGVLQILCAACAKPIIFVAIASRAAFNAAN